MKILRANVFVVEKEQEGDHITFYNNVYKAFMAPRVGRQTAQ